MNSYETSNNVRVSKGYIDYQIKKTKSKLQQKFMIDPGYRYCEICGRNENNTILDWAHIISVNECQKRGKSELAWAEENIKSMCRDCHNNHDKT